MEIKVPNITYQNNSKYNKNPKKKSDKDKDKRENSEPDFKFVFAEKMDSKANFDIKA